MNRDVTIKPTVQKYWNYLTSHFTADYIQNYMDDIDEFIVGKGRRDSFCNIVETQLKSLGNIKGSFATKFGLYYGYFGKGSEKDYRFVSRFGSSVKEAFKNIRSELANLIRTTQRLKTYKEIDSKFTGMFKHKIMYLYNPVIMIPSFIKEDLQHFEDCLGLRISKTFESAQRAMLSYKKEHYPNISNHAFMIKLYNEYGRYNVAQTKEANETADYQLNKKLIYEKDPIDEYITHPVEKTKLKKSSEGSYYYPRDSKAAAYALRNARHQCEYDKKHNCFIRRSNDIPYTEVHHLIPLSYHYKFKNSLDVPENIVSLCSNCHNEIHYGRDADKLIEKLFNERKQKLHDAQIDVMIDGQELTLEILIELYHRLNGRK